MSVTTASILLLWTMVILLAFASSGLMRQLRELEHRLTAWGVGDPVRRSVVVAPDVTLGSGERLQPPYLALFVSASCSVCIDLLARLPSSWPQGGFRLPTVVIGSGEGSTEPLGSVVSDGLPPQVYLLEDDSDIALRFAVPGFPWLVEVDTSNRIVTSESGAPISKVLRILGRSADGRDQTSNQASQVIRTEARS